MTISIRQQHQEAVTETPVFTARISTILDLDRVKKFFAENPSPNIHPRSDLALAEACQEGRVIVIRDHNDVMVGMSARYAHTFVDEEGLLKFHELGSVMIAPSAARQNLASQMIALQICAAYFLEKPENRPDIVIADFVHGNDPARDMFKKMQWADFDDGDAGRLREQCYTTHTIAHDGKTNWCMFAQPQLVEMAKTFNTIFMDKGNLELKIPLLNAYQRMMQYASDHDPQNLARLAHRRAKAAAQSGPSRKAA